jgi:hypothetical protein
MTVLAVVAARYMRRMFADRGYAVMARPASADNLCVIDGECRYPHVRVVAVLANISCLNMGRTLARCFDTVMAAGTITGNTDMIEVSGQPSGRRMAVVTIIAGRDMRRMFASGRCAVVARATGTNYLAVIYSISRRKYIGVVAIFANIRSLNVGRSFANGVNTVVTAGTVVDDAQMIESCRTPRNR